jgi:hypothetical protein
MRTTLMYVARTGHRFQSRLLQLLEQQEILPIAFISSHVDELIWVMLQVEGPWARIHRLHTKILGLPGVDSCTEQQVVAPGLQQVVAEAICFLISATDLRSQPDKRTRTFRGLQ